MALKDWKKIDNSNWVNKKTKEELIINKGEWEDHYHIYVGKNDDYRIYDNALFSKKEALLSAKSYMQSN